LAECIMMLWGLPGYKPLRHLCGHSLHAALRQLVLAHWLLLCATG
jgi:hypothetical protein